MMMRYLALAVGLISIHPVSAQEMQILSAPEVGELATVPAGAEVYSFFRIYTLDGAQLDVDSGPGSYLRGPAVPAGTSLVPVSTKSAFKGCVTEPGTFTAKGPCLMDDDGDGFFDRQATNDYNIAQRLKNPVPYTRKKIAVTREDSFKRTFLFQGATSDSLRFSYREFSNDMARPGFTEDLTIPREPFPAMIMLKDIQIEVLGVSGMGLRYRVIKVGPR